MERIEVIEKSTTTIYYLDISNLLDGNEMLTIGKKFSDMLLSSTKDDICTHI